MISANTWYMYIYKGNLHKIYKFLSHVIWYLSFIKNLHDILIPIFSQFCLTWDRTSHITDWLSQHIETETKLPPCCRRHFRMNFWEWKSLYFNSDSTLRFLPRIPVKYKLALVQKMAQHHTSDKPLSWLKTAFFTEAYVCITLPPWVNASCAGIILGNICAVSIISQHW